MLSESELHLVPSKGFLVGSPMTGKHWKTWENSQETKNKLLGTDDGDFMIDISSIVRHKLAELNHSYLVLTITVKTTRKGKKVEIY